MHVAAWYCRSRDPRTKVHQIQEISVNWPDCLMLQNFVTCWQEVYKISAVKNFCTPEKWTKVHQNRAPSPVPNFIAFGQMVYEKSVTKFFILLPHGTSWAKVHQSRHWYTARPGLPTRHSSFPSDNRSTGHLLPNFTDFITSIINKNAVNDMYLHIMRRQWKSCKKCQVISWNWPFLKECLPICMVFAHCCCLPCKVCTLTWTQRPHNQQN